MTQRIGGGGSSGFVCPLRRACLSSRQVPYASFADCNQAVAAIRGLPCGATRADATGDLYGRLTPLVRKTLRRFCYPLYQGSRCAPGACFPEELLGETYLSLDQAVNRYDPVRGVDFVGFFQRQLQWDLAHRAERLWRGEREMTLGTAGEEESEIAVADEPDEDTLLSRVVADELLGRLGPEDAELIIGAAEGFTSRELAERTRASEAGVRKRIQRIRDRLRQPA